MDGMTLKCFWQIVMFQGVANLKALKSTSKALWQALSGQRQVKCFFGGYIGYNPIPPKALCLSGAEAGRKNFSSRGGRT